MLLSIRMDHAAGCESIRFSRQRPGLGPLKTYPVVHKNGMYPGISGEISHEKEQHSHVDCISNPCDSTGNSGLHAGRRKFIYPVLWKSDIHGSAGSVRFNVNAICRPASEKRKRAPG